MNLWRRSKPADVSVDVPIPRTEVPMEGPTEGELARMRAERALSEEIERTEQVRAETQEYATLAERLRLFRERNHIRDDVIRSVTRSA